MPAIRNRTVLGVNKDLSGFLYLNVGLTRGPVPDYDRMIEEARSTTVKQERQIRLSQEQISERERQVLQTRQQLMEKERQLQEAEKQLLDKDGRLADLQAGVDRARGAPHDERLYSDITEVLSKIPIDLGGGCSLDKAYLLAWLIRRHDMKQTVDIGVYRGRSFFPQALAHNRFTGGMVYGVDPYSAAEAREKDVGSAHHSSEAINRFIERADWQAIRQSVVSMRKEFGYEDHCALLQKTSAEAGTHFEEKRVSFDMVHVDGNHDTDKVMEDVHLHLPRVREDGFIVLDDVSFQSVRPAYEELNARTTLVFERTDHDGANDFAVFRNAPPSPGTTYERRSWTSDFW